MDTERSFEKQLGIHVFYCKVSQQVAILFRGVLSLLHFCRFGVLTLDQVRVVTIRHPQQPAKA